MLPVKTTLLVNGLSSAATGAGLMILSETVAGIFGLSNSGVFFGTGLFLLIFGLGVTIAGMKKRPGSGSVKFISTLDIIWVLASIALVLADGHLMTTIGNIIILAIAAWVGMMAFLQLKGLKTTAAGPATSRA